MSAAEGVLLILCLLAGTSLGGWVLYRWPKPPPDPVSASKEAFAQALSDLLSEALPGDLREARSGKPAEGIAPGSRDSFDDPTLSFLDLALGQQGLSRDAVRVAVLEERVRHLENDLTQVRGDQIGEGKVVAVVLYVLASIGAVAVVAVDLLKGS